MLPDIEFDEDLSDVNLMEKSKGWLVCDHFEKLNDIVEHYKNFHPIIVFSGIILCENCYRNMINGKNPHVNRSSFEFTNAHFKNKFAEALIEANRKMQSDSLIQ